MLLIELLRKEVDSSNIASIGYDAENEHLQVEFVSGSVYNYYDVPQDTYDELMDALSKGSYFYYNVRTDYEFQKESINKNMNKNLLTEVEEFLKEAEADETSEQEETPKEEAAEPVEVDIPKEEPKTSGKAIPQLEEFAKKNKMSVDTESEGIQTVTKNTPVGSIKITGYISPTNKIEYKYSFSGGPVVSLDTVKLEDKKYNEPDAALKTAEAFMNNWEAFITKNINPKKAK